MPVVKSRMSAVQPVEPTGVPRPLGVESIFGFDALSGDHPTVSHGLSGEHIALRDRESHGGTDLGLRFRWKFFQLSICADQQHDSLDRGDHALLPALVRRRASAEFAQRAARHQVRARSTSWAPWRSQNSTPREGTWIKPCRSIGLGRRRFRKSLWLSGEHHQIPSACRKETCGSDTST